MTFTLKPEAAKHLLSKTESRVGQMLVITVDDEFLIAPIIRAPLGRNIMISSGSLYNAKTQALFDKLLE